MIIDRTAIDVEYAKQLIKKIRNMEVLSETENKNFINGLRGCYNASDLNRVELKVKELSVILNNMGYPNAVDTKTDWDISDIVAQSDIMRYLNNISVIRETYYMPPYTPPVPSMDEWIDYITANNIEKILLFKEKTINSLSNDLLYCGEFYPSDDKDEQLNEVI